MAKKVESQRNESVSLNNLPIDKKTQIYVNGVLLVSGKNNDYVVSDQAITFLQAPGPEDVIKLSTMDFYEEVVGYIKVSIGRNASKALLRDYVLCTDLDNFQKISLLKHFKLERK